MIGPRPRPGDNAPGHRVKRARLSDGAEVNVNKDSAEHDQREDVMKQVADLYRDSASGLWKPHQKSCNQKHQAAEDNLPKLKLLATVVEAYVFRLDFVLILRVSLDFSEPLAVSVGPGHQAAPIEKLEEPGDDEPDAEPRMQEPRHRASSEQRGEPAKCPRRVDGHTGQQRQEEKDRHRPVKKPGVGCMTQQLVFPDDCPAESAKIAHNGFIIRFSRCRHTSSSPASGCGRLGPVKM